MSVRKTWTAKLAKVATNWPHATRRPEIVITATVDDSIRGHAGRLIAIHVPMADAEALIESLREQIATNRGF